MGFSDGKLAAAPVRWRQNSSNAECPQTAHSSRTDFRHTHRERRFHVRQEALGLDFQGYDVLEPTPPSPLSPPQSAPELPLTDAEPVPLSEREMARQMARDGMRICAWILWCVLVCVNLKRIGALLDLAARAWPNLY